MDISTREQDGLVFVSVKGKVVRENQAELRRQLEAIIAAGMDGIALDFDRVDYIDSAGLGCCAAAHKLLREKGGGELVMYGASPNIQKMWKLIRLDLVIPVCKGRKEAVERLRAGRAVPGA